MDAEIVLNSISAKIAGIAAPFLGVDGTNACNQIFLSDGETPAKCPLTAGQDYVYKNSFPVLEIYPKVCIIF